MSTYVFNTLTNRQWITDLLVYMAMHLKHDGGCALDFVDMTGKSLFPSTTKIENTMYCLGKGLHRVSFEDCVLDVQIKICFPHNGSVVTHNFYSGIVLGKEIKITGLKSKEQLTKLLEESRKYISGFSRTPSQTHYLYDCKERTMTKLSNNKHRPRHSLFLKEGQAEQLLDCVKTFIDSKEEYEKHFVPYKLNIFFHGLPGTGKTSLVNMVATEFKLDVMIVPFSPSLTDESLVAALTKASEYKFGIVVMEDVDCLFEQDRMPGQPPSKLTLSGLLNALDGMLRIDGLIVFLTANITKTIDAALLRTSRYLYFISIGHISF